MSALKVGQSAPGFALHTVDGVPLSLAELIQSGDNVLLVFLRHLG